MMTAEQFDRQLCYCAIMVYAKRLLQYGEITQSHFNKVHLHFVRKYRPIIEIF